LNQIPEKKCPQALEQRRTQPQEKNPVQRIKSQKKSSEIHHRQSEIEGATAARGPVAERNELDKRTMERAGLVFIQIRRSRPEGRRRMACKRREGGRTHAPGGAGELVELAARGEDDEPDLSVAEHGELVGLLEQPVAALGEGHLPARRVLYPLQLRLPPHHRRRSLPP